MPGTFNGIGTHYYGKQSLEKRLDACEQCGANVELETYETRLWFVIFFIPIIPLGRKKVIDYCPACTAHHSVPLERWKKFERETIGTGVAAMSENPDDPQAALKLLAALASFHKRDEAAKLADIMTSKFPDHAGVQFALGSYYEQQGNDDRANACFEKAYQLDPATPDHRRAVGLIRLEQKRLDDARELLEPFLAPGPDQDPAVLLLLARAHQDRGEHREALELHQTALEGFPDLGTDKEFRRHVAASEAALGKTPSILPRKMGVRGRVLIACGAAAAVLLVLFLINGYLADRQTLYIVNGLPAPVRVRIGDAVDVELGAISHHAVTLPEGAHRALVTRAGAPEETIEFQITNRLLDRLCRDSVFVLNPAAAAVLLWEEVTYSHVPQLAEAPGRTLHHGQTFFSFRDVDYAFKEPPAQVETDGSSETRTHVAMIAAEPVGVLSCLVGRVSAEQLLDQAELFLATRPDDPPLIRAYAVLALRHKMAARAAAFLEKGLGRTPIEIEWHRKYQDVAQKAGATDGLIGRYDALLKREPGSGALLYLRGRIEPRSSIALTYFDRAIAADKTSPYPWLAKGFSLAARGAFAEAKTMYAEAARLQPDQPDIEDGLFAMRFALGEYPALEKELRAKQTADPIDLHLQAALLRVLAAQGKQPAVEKADQAYERAVRVRLPGDPYQLTLLSRSVRLYLQGDLGGLLRTGRALEDPERRRAALFLAHLERGELEQAADALAGQTAPEDAYNSLLLSVAWGQKGDAGRARTWLDKAVAAFKDAGPLEKELARLLLAGETLRLEDVDDVKLAARGKRILVVALAANAPAHRAGLLDRARKLNYNPTAPHRFLTRAIAHLANK